MKRYAVVGISSRAISAYMRPMVKNFTQHAQIVALLDNDPVRFEVAKEQIKDLPDLPTFAPDAFDAMIDQTKPDVIMVMTRDHMHEHYVLAALRRNIDVIVEKPMTINCEQATRIIEAEAQSQAKVTVTHNVRFGAYMHKLKELLHAGRVGHITQVDFNCYIDTHHGATYFKRWNRLRENSGGLTIHKSSHHFDIVNWLISQEPTQVFAYAALNYYGKDAEMNPSKKDGRHCRECDEREACAYEMRWSPQRTSSEPGEGSVEEHLRIIRKQKYTNYRTDQCIFDSQINIEDTYSATVRFDGGAMMSYSENFSMPYEGYRLAINGTQGRVELNLCETRGTFEAKPHELIYYPLFSGAREVIEPLMHHGDPLMLEELFLGPPRHAKWVSLGTAREGALAVAVGEAVWRSGQANRPYNISELLSE